MKKAIVLICLFLMPCHTVFSQNKETDKVAAIKKVLFEAYIEGIHINRDSEAARKGFHRDFVMHVYTDEGLIKASLDMWLDRLHLDGKKNPKSIEHRFEFVDVAGNAAVVKMEIFEEREHIYTDYFSLYEFADGWKIVGKIFYSH